MSYLKLLLLCGGLSSITVVFGQSEPNSVVIPNEHLQPFFNQYCVECHGPNKEKGQVRLDQLAYEVTNNDEAQRWQDILDALNGADMPPEDEEQPSVGELTEVLNILTKNILKARNSLTETGGKITLRKVNQREYVNTAKHLFGFRLVKTMVPADATYEKFDTVGVEQKFEAHHFDQYFELGSSLVAEGIRTSRRPRAEPKTRRVEVDGWGRDQVHKKIDSDLKKGNKKVNAFAQSILELPSEYLDSGTYLTGFAFGEYNKYDFQIKEPKVDPRAFYKVRIAAGLHGDPPEVRKFIYIQDYLTDTGGAYTTLKVSGTPANPEVIEFQVPATFSKREIAVPIRENRSLDRNYLKSLGSKGNSPASIWVDWVEIEGPYYESGPSFFEKLYTSRRWNDENVNELISDFAYEAFRRREADEQYLKALMEVFRASRAEKMKFEDAVSQVLGLILASPEFLYLAEAVDTPGRLSDREFAVRLAYFLWGAPPDARLYNAAERDDLSDPIKLQQIVDRMLIDPRAMGFYEGFVGQWAQLERYDEMMNSLPKNKYLNFNRGIQYSAKQEVIRFFKVLVDENLSVSNLIDSDFIVANECLATHYGFLGLGTNDFVKLLLPDDSPRGGLMTQAVFLSVGSNGERNSPVVRGKMVMEKLLDDPVPEPPPNVPELASAATGPVTMREMVLSHQEQPQCASCHKKMDPVGFALENFDLTGSWRKYEDVGATMQEIRTDGVFPTGEAFSDLNELRGLMMKQKERVAQSMIKSLLSYGLGRTIEFSDTNKIEELRDKLKESDYAMLEMIHAIVSDPVFRSK